MTPALLRYKQLKEQNPNTVLLYRMGDFYECFYEDAITISKTLEITLTSRDKGPNKTPMAGIPYHALDTYLVKLIDAGFKVAVAEQEEEKQKDEKTGKTKIVIHRNVSRIVTPSTYDRESDYKSHYLVSIVTDDIKKIINKEENICIAIACIDPNGSTFWSTSFNNLLDLDNELFKINPSEIIATDEIIRNANFSNYLYKNFQILTPIEKSFVNNQEKLLDHLKIKSFKTLGLDNEVEIKAATACFNYLRTTQQKELSHINSLFHKVNSKLMRIDNNTIRNLEILNSYNPGGITLLNILDQTKTRGGKRLLREWLISPLKDIKLIQARLESVKYIIKNDFSELSDYLENIYDLERIAARISFGTATPRDLVSLNNSLSSVRKLSEKYAELVNKNIAKNLNEIFKLINIALDKIKILSDKISTSLVDPAPANIKDGHFINIGVSNELDELRQMNSDSKKWLRNLEIIEQQKTGIATLRVKYNRVFGYFLEVSKSQISKIPENYIRKQTTVNGERYITTELKEKESMILGANERIIELEQQIYNELLEFCKNYIQDILNIQKAISELDTYNSFAIAAQLNNYCEPVFNERHEYHAIDARHPVVEHLTKEIYVFNDINLQKNEMILITGPNMGGKSTYIRMTALIAYMAHIGCFVPAKTCSMCIFDSIFTRVGASDDISKGESTFMVEMTEAANILRNATDKSLIILDEIGRGTSTYDGMSIAWAIVNYIHESIKAKTLFATHYHELTVLEDELAHMKNYTVAISESDGEVVFLRKIEKGKAERSFGIHVAKLAGLPNEVLNKANEILKVLEETKINVGAGLKPDLTPMGLWEFTQEPSPVGAGLSRPDVEQEIKNLDLNNMTPIQALEKLNDLKKQIKP